MDYLKYCHKNIGGSLTAHGTSANWDIDFIREIITFHREMETEVFIEPRSFRVAPTD